jgi:hypothetical protein
MQNRTLVLACFLFFLLLNSCRTSKMSPTLALDKQHAIHYLNTVLAGEAITTDQTDRYFELVQPIEISTQMHMPVSTLPTDRKELINSYGAYLKADVADFTTTERKQIDPIMREIFQTCQKVAPGLFPERIRLIKTTAKHYGEGVYYTREDCIVIPIDVLENFELKAFKETMYHEVWHIISRQHPKVQTAAYALIGFTPQPTVPIKMPKRLRERLLYNPDGVDMNWQIRLKPKTSDGQVVTCIPLLHTVSDGYTADKPTFFSYVEFNLYPVSGGRVITTADSLTSPIKLADEPSFFQQITDNTNYIIHPDEVIADNFMFIMTTSDDVMKRQKFSEAGNNLIKQLEMVLKTVR